MSSSCSDSDSGFHIAQLNIARSLDSLDSPLLAEFMAKLEPINALAEQSPGFVWRLQSEEGDATSYTLFDDKTIPNMTVWKDIKSLHDYVYKSGHIDVMKKRKQWFEHMKEAFQVLWWIPAGHIPNLFEAQKKLELLRAKGPSPEAFTFRKPFPAPTANTTETWTSFDGQCPA